MQLICIKLYRPLYAILSVSIIADIQNEKPINLQTKHPKFLHWYQTSLCQIMHPVSSVSQFHPSGARDIDQVAACGLD